MFTRVRALPQPSRLSFGFFYFFYFFFNRIGDLNNAWRDRGTQRPDEI